MSFLDRSVAPVGKIKKRYIRSKSRKAVGKAGKTLQQKQKQKYRHDIETFIKALHANECTKLKHFLKYMKLNLNP